MNRNLRILMALLIAAAFVAETNAQPPKIENSAPSLLAPLNPANWSMPKMPKMSWKLPSLGRQPKRVRTTQPSFWTTVSRKTKTTWNKTTAALNPFGKTKSRTKKPSFFDQLFTVKEEPQPITTVGDFLSQPRTF